MTCQNNCKHKLCRKSVSSDEAFQDRLEKYLSPDFGNISREITKCVMDDLGGIPVNSWDCSAVEKAVQKFAVIEGDFEIGLPLEKAFEQKDGSLIVFGKASGNDEDHDGEIVDQATLRKLYDQYMQNPIIKYMHGRHPKYPEAIGTALDAWRHPVTKDVYRSEFTNDGPQLLSKISAASDLEPIRTRIKEGVLKGYSIGGKLEKKVKEFNKSLGRFTTRVFAKAWTETSIVDTPSYKKAFFTVLAKSAHDNNGANGISLLAGIGTASDDPAEDAGKVKRVKKLPPKKNAEGPGEFKDLSIKSFEVNMTKEQIERLESIEKKFDEIGKSIGDVRLQGLPKRIGHNYGRTPTNRSKAKKIRLREKTRIKRQAISEGKV